MIILRLSFTHSLVCFARDEMLSLYWKGTAFLKASLLGFNPVPAVPAVYERHSFDAKNNKKMLFLIVFLGIWGALLAFNPSYELRHQVRLLTSASTTIQTPAWQRYTEYWVSSRECRSRWLGMSGDACDRAHLVSG